MPDIPIRALAGLALALVLAAFAAPTRQADAGLEPTVEVAAAGEPVVFDLLDLDLDLPTPAPRTAAVEAASAEAVAAAMADLAEVEAAVAYVAEVEAAEAAAAAPAPQPAPAPAPAGSIDEIIARYFGPAAGQARAIAACESKLDPNAVSRTNDHGLFQINIVHQGDFQRVTGRPWSAVYDPEANTAYAKWLYDQQGWGPWACRRVL